MCEFEHNTSKVYRSFAMLSLSSTVVRILKPFDEATVAVSNEGSSAAFVIPVIN